MITNYQKIKHLGSGKSGDSFLIMYEGSPAVLKIMHKKPFINGHTFTIEDELRSYHLLSKLPIDIPKIFTYSKDESYLIKSYIPGDTLAVYISKNDIPIDLYLESYQKFIEYEQLGFNIDYFPTNFVIHNNKLFYVDYEINPYDQKWNFLNWGIHFWFNQEGFKHYYNHQESLSKLISSKTNLPFEMNDHKEMQIFLKKIKEGASHLNQ